ncbi:aldehyde dehydrogenase [Sphingobium amiense]|uniref:Aldehyde dehydrogenase n=2 Tax=Sphingobium amiense TaxID=135719 RepID=A0A494WF72_9SPHN|nr:aldehyde dehydrogenase family protein [Sphingobium amiense]BBD99640.1 aldehyde dehydrogenase [Sphingobium amiense]
MQPQPSLKPISPIDDAVLPSQRNLYYGGEWHSALRGGTLTTYNPATGAEICTVADAEEHDVDAAVAAARAGFAIWRDVPPLERTKIMREMAVRLRGHAEYLALLDAIDGGNPVRMLRGDVEMAAGQLEFFAGLVTEMKGASIPMGPGAVNFSTREPQGIVARIIPFNHPLMFCAGKAAAPLAAGNAVIMKPPEQAPLSALKLAELWHGLLPPGVLNILPGGRAAGAALATHPDIAMVTVVGSVATGRAVMRAAAETIKPVLLELGGKNALIALPDADPEEVADAVIRGMNFDWCGQSCGSTSRAFIHDSLYDAVIQKAAEKIRRFRPGVPSDPETVMGAIASQAQYDRVASFVQSGIADGARLVSGGKHPEGNEFANGWFFEPTLFADVTMDMAVAREEIFGPVLSVLRWSDEAELIAQVNQNDLGLTCSIWTNDLHSAHRLAGAVEAGYVWVNEVARHFLGAPFGGVRQSGLGREECLEELLAFTREKNIHIRLKSPAA